MIKGASWKNFLPGCCSQPRWDESHIALWVSVASHWHLCQFLPSSGGCDISPLLSWFGRIVALWPPVKAEVNLPTVLCSLSWVTSFWSKQFHDTLSTKMFLSLSRKLISLSPAVQRWLVTTIPLSFTWKVIGGFIGSYLHLLIDVFVLVLRRVSDSWNGACWALPNWPPPPTWSLCALTECLWMIGGWCCWVDSAFQISVHAYFMPTWESSSMGIII